MGHCFAAMWLSLHFSELIQLHRSQKQLHFKLLCDLSPRPVLKDLGSNVEWMAASNCLWITREIKVLCDTVLGLKGRKTPDNKLNEEERFQAPAPSYLWCCITRMVLLAGLGVPFWLLWIPQQCLEISHGKYLGLTDRDFKENYFIQ